MNIGRSIHYFQMGLDDGTTIVKHSELRRYNGGTFASMCPTCGSGPLIMRKRINCVVDAHDSCIQCRAKFVYSDIIEIRKLDGFTIPRGL